MEQSENTQQQKRKIHPLNAVIYLCAILSLVIGSWYIARYFLSRRDFEETDDAQIEVSITPISARAGGFIREIRFSEHSKVSKGDTLLMLEDREYKIKRSLAAAAYQDVTAQINVLQAQINTARSSASIDREMILSAASKLKYQNSELTRFNKLLLEEAATGQQAEQVRTAFEIAGSDFRASRKSYLTSLARVRELEAKKSILLADLEMKRAEMELAGINLSYTAVRAPQDGTMGRKSITVGQQVSPGQVLCSLVLNGEIWAVANFKETQIQGMHVGQPVEITSDALEQGIFSGNIEAISASTGSKFSLIAPDNSVGNFVKIVQRIPVRISLSSGSLQELKPGMNIRVRVKKHN